MRIFIVMTDQLSKALQSMQIKRSLLTKLLWFLRTLWKRYGLNVLLISSQLMTSSYKSIFCSASAKCTHSLVSALKLLKESTFKESPFLEDGQLRTGRSLCEGSLQILEPLSFFGLETVSSMWGLCIGVCHSGDPGTSCVGPGTCFRGWMVQGNQSLTGKVFLSSGELGFCLFSCI